VTERTRTEVITFLHPFQLRDVEGLLSAGSYLVETTEETIDAVSFVAYRRLSTTIALPAINPATPHDSAAFRQIVTIDPKDLANALFNDDQTSHRKTTA
jgi:hypothetical protein